jgi:hypothetical protein
MLVLLGSCWGLEPSFDVPAPSMMRVSQLVEGDFNLLASFHFGTFQVLA